MTCFHPAYHLKLSVFPASGTALHPLYWGTVPARYCICTNYWHLFILFLICLISNNSTWNWRRWKGRRRGSHPRSVKLYSSVNTYIIIIQQCHKIFRNCIVRVESCCCQLSCIFFSYQPKLSTLFLLLQSVLLAGSRFWSALLLRSQWQCPGPTPPW